MNEADLSQQSLSKHARLIASLAADDHVTALQYTSYAY